MTIACKHDRKVRFLIVGTINTCIDFCLLFLLFSVFNIQKEVANIISTTAGLCFSFSANRRFTFTPRNRHSIRQLLLFIIVTVFGLWVLQGFIIWLIAPSLLQLGLGASGALITAKIIATTITLIYNYVLYSRLVFR